MRYANLLVLLLLAGCSSIFGPGCRPEIVDYSFPEHEGWGMRSVKIQLCDGSTRRCTDGPWDGPLTFETARIQGFANSCLV